MTGQPDFATFTIVYTPGEKIVELKSMKLYLYTNKFCPIWIAMFIKPISKNKTNCIIIRVLGNTCRCSEKDRTVTT